MLLGLFLLSAADCSKNLLLGLQFEAHGGENRVQLAHFVRVDVQSEELVAVLGGPALLLELGVDVLVAVR